MIVGCKNTIIPETVTSIGNAAFQGCNSMTSIIIPGSVTSIGNQAFHGCSNLTSLTIPSSVTSIGNHVFSRCSNLTSINVEPENNIYDSRDDCNAIIETATNTLISGCVNTIIPDAITSIANGAFLGRVGLSFIIIPNNVTSIGVQAFADCCDLASITIPYSVTSIGRKAFDGCSNLISVTVENGTPVEIEENTFSNRSNATLYVPVGSKAAYKAANYWKEFKRIVEIPYHDSNLNPYLVTVGSTGFATFCSYRPLDFSGITGIKAYIASGFNPTTGKLVLTQVTEVPVGEGLYIVGTPGEYIIPEKTTAMFYANLLKGVTTAITIYPTEEDNTNFILSNGSHGVAFYTLSNDGILAAGKAYLQLPTESVAGVKALKIFFEDEDDDPTGIAITSAGPNEEEAIYNIAGLRLSTAQKGLNIINGKKVIVK